MSNLITKSHPNSFFLVVAPDSPVLGESPTWKEKPVVVLQAVPTMVTRHQGNSLIHLTVEVVEKIHFGDGSVGQGLVAFYKQQLDQN